MPGEGRCLSGVALEGADSVEVGDGVEDGGGCAVGGWVVVPGDCCAEGVGWPGDPAQPELWVGAFDVGGAFLELVEELVEHNHPEQAEQGQVAAGHEVVAAVGVLVGEVDRGGGDSGAPHDPVAAVRSLLLADRAEGQQRERDADSVQRAGDEVLPAVVPAEGLPAEGDQTVEGAGEHHRPEQRRWDHRRYGQGRVLRLGGTGDQLGVGNAFAGPAHPSPRRRPGADGHHHVQDRKNHPHAGRNAVEELDRGLSPARCSVHRSPSVSSST